MEEKQELAKNTSKKKGWIILALLVIVIAVALIGGGVYYLSKPKAIFQDSYDYLTKGFKKVEESELKKLIAKNDKAKYTIDTQIELNKSLNLGIENIDLLLTLKEDKTEKLMQYNLNSKINDQDLLELDAILKDSKMYMTIKKIMDKYYYIEQEAVSLSETFSEEDLEVLTDIVADALKKEITDDKFTKEDVTIKVDEKDEKVKKISLKVTDKLLSEVITEICTNMKNSDKAMASLEKLLGETKEEITKSLDEMINDVKETTGETLFTYNIYYKGINQIRKLELLSDKDAISYTANNEKYQLQFTSNGTMVLKLEIAKEKEAYKINAVMEGLIITGDCKENDGETTINLEIKEITTNQVGTITAKVKDVSDTESNLEMTLKIAGTELATIKMNTKVTFGESITVNGLENAKDMNNITEEEIAAILNNLEQHPVIGPLMSTFEGLLGNNNQTDIYEENDMNDDFLENNDDFNSFY